MIRQFQIYSEEELSEAKINFGQNVHICNDVILHNPHNMIIGDNVRIDSQSIIMAGNSTKIILGNNVHISAGCYFFGGSANIIFEDFCGTAANVILHTGTDDYTEGYMTNPMVSDEYKKVRKGDIILRKHCVVGSGSIILPNVTLEFATSVGANSLVTKSTKPFDVLFGSPAKVIRKRKNVFLK